MPKQPKQAKPKKQSTAREPEKDSADARDERDRVAREAAREAGDDGELTDIHTPTANDRSPRNEDRAEARGENWVDSLEQRSAEGGPKPEEEIDLTDDETNGRRDR